MREERRFLKKDVPKQKKPAKEKLQPIPSNPRKISSIVIALDDYADIFSDFDIGPYQHRLLSDDFLKEIQKRYMENKKGDVEVKLSLPQKLRNPRVERVIKKRLRDYFNFQARETEKEIKKRRIHGIIYVIIGFFLLATEYNLTASEFTGIIPNALGILLLPAGWFSMWNGLDLIIQIPEEITEKRKLYTKFAKANYLFVSEEELEEMERRGQEQAKPHLFRQTHLRVFL